MDITKYFDYVLQLIHYNAVAAEKSISLAQHGISHQYL